MTYHRVCNKINTTTGATSGTGTAYPSGALEFTSGFCWCSCYSIFSFMGMFCRLLFVLLYFFFWPLCCLFFFDLRILVTPLVSSNSSGIASFSSITRAASICSVSSLSDLDCPQLSHTSDEYSKIVLIDRLKSDKKKDNAYISIDCI